MHNFEARKVTFVVSHLVMGLDRWAHDGGRPWRQGHQLEEEGFKGFQKRFGASAFALHHRFYLHLDVRGHMWLSAEDGCEGEPVQWS